MGHSTIVPPLYTLSYLYAMSYTKGKWNLQDFSKMSKESCSIGIRSEQGKLICTAFFQVNYDDCPKRDEAEANAKLIAQAPNLLKALKDSLQILEQTLRYRESNKLTMGNTFLKSAIQDSKNAIKKATE